MLHQEWPLCWYIPKILLKVQPNPIATHCICSYIGMLPYPTLRKVHVVIFTPCGDFCGGFHHKCKSPQILVAVFTTNTCGSFRHKCESPQVFVVILFEVGSKVRERYESITGRVNMFDSMCKWYLVCNRGTFLYQENPHQKGRNDTTSVDTVYKKKGDAI